MMCIVLWNYTYRVLYYKETKVSEVKKQYMNRAHCTVYQDERSFMKKPVDEYHNGEEGSFTSRTTQVNIQVFRQDRDKIIKGNQQIRAAQNFDVIQNTRGIII